MFCLDLEMSVYFLATDILEALILCLINVMEQANEQTIIWKEMIIATSFLDTIHTRIEEDNDELMEDIVPIFEHLTTFFE